MIEEDILQEKECSNELRENLEELLRKMNEVEDAWGKPLIVTSGFRSKEDQIRIYTAKGITDESQMHMTSKHFSCQAVDVSDPNRELQKWVKENIKLVEKIGLWMEDFASTPNWLHFQSVPPKSGRRFFIP